MYNAPPVVYPVGRFVWGPYLACALGGLSMCVLGWSFWQSGASVHSLFWQVAACLVLVAGCGSLLSKEFLQQGELAWDGESWQRVGTTATEGPIQLALTFDGGHFMLVSMRSGGRHDRRGLRLHACLRRVDMPSRWHGFRCAVYSRRTDKGN